MSDETEKTERLVECYRVGLGLEPWDKFAARSPAPPRRTGRTALGLLTSIARCERSGRGMLVVQGGNLSNESYCVAMAREMIDKLHLGVIVHPVSARRHRGMGYVVCVDHLAYEIDSKADVTWQREYLGEWVSQTAEDWAKLGLTPPDNVWVCQSVTESIGTMDIEATGDPTGVTGWRRASVAQKGVTIDGVSDFTTIYAGDPHAPEAKVALRKLGWDPSVMDHGGPIHPLRPDGFAQSAVDQAKATLLASVPKGKR